MAISAGFHLIHCSENVVIIKSFTPPGPQSTWSFLPAHHSKLPSVLSTGLPDSIPTPSTQLSFHSVVQTGHDVATLVSDDPGSTRALIPRYRTPNPTFVWSIATMRRPHSFARNDHRDRGSRTACRLLRQSSWLEHFFRYGLPCPFAFLYLIPCYSRRPPCEGTSRVLDVSPHHTFSIPFPPLSNASPATFRRRITT